MSYPEAYDDVNKMPKNNNLCFIAKSCKFGPAVQQCELCATIGAIQGRRSQYYSALTRTEN